MSSNDFQQNACRLCQKVFCCENCRVKHEINLHQINPECDICISGRVFLRDPSESLLEHIRNNHWPLHCVYCKRVFNTVEEIFLHNKCAKSFNEQDNENNNTPQISCKSNVQSCVPTSTPKEDENEYLYKISDFISPVDLAIQNNLHKSAFTPNNYSDRKNEQYLKRRVTFSEAKEIDGNENMSSTTNSNYITAELKTPTLLAIDETDEKAQNDINEAVALQMTTENETLWESALNDFEYENVSILENDRPSDTGEEAVGIWGSMTNMIKNVMQGLSNSQEGNSSFLPLKRRHVPADDKAQSPPLKKMKLTDIKCRRPIRYMKPAVYVRYGRKRMNGVNKNTQTD